MLSKPTAQMAAHRPSEITSTPCKYQSAVMCLPENETSHSSLRHTRKTSAPSGLIAMLGGQVRPALHVMRLISFHKVQQPAVAAAPPTCWPAVAKCRRDATQNTAAITKSDSEGW